MFQNPLHEYFACLLERKNMIALKVGSIVPCFLIKIKLINDSHHNNNSEIIAVKVP